MFSKYIFIPGFTDKCIKHLQTCTNFQNINEIILINLVFRVSIEMKSTQKPCRSVLQCKFRNHLQNVSSQSYSILLKIINQVYSKECVQCLKVSHLCFGATTAESQITPESALRFHFTPSGFRHHMRC